MALNEAKWNRKTVKIDPGYILRKSGHHEKWRNRVSMKTARIVLLKYCENYTSLNMSNTVKMQISLIAFSNFLKSKNSKNCVSLKTFKIVTVSILWRFRQSKNVLRQSERSGCSITMKNLCYQKLVKIVLV